MKYTSASDMHSKDSCQVSSVKSNEEKINYENSLVQKVLVIFLLLFTVHCSLFTVHCHSEVIDRVVAYVDDTAITFSELKENYEKMKKTVADIKKEEVINSMINRLLLLKEAMRMKLEAPTDNELLKDYIDIKIGALILIKEDAIGQFYAEHINEFKGRDYLSVRDEIEKYLFEMETNKRLEKHLEELRANAEVKMQLKDK